MTKISRRQTLGLGFGAGFSLTMLGRRRGGAGRPANTTFSLLLVNDIYKMSDDKGRGGFAKLAAVVKQERARNVPMLFCHAGDTFSPSLMSGFDQGAHIVELTNMVKPDVFVPGNHEFDFGKDNYMKRMGESNFPYFAANMRQADGSPIPGMKDSQIFTLGPVKIGVVGLILATVPNMSQPGDLKFGPEMEALRAQTTALRQQGADLILCVAHTDRDMDNQIVRSRLVDVLLTGHDHDLAIGYDGKTVMVESSEEGNFVTAIDFVATVTGEGQGPQGGLGPELPGARFLHHRSGSGGARRREALRGGAVEGTRRGDRHERHRARQPLGHGALAGGGHRQPHRRCHQGVHGRRRGDHQRRRHPRQQAVPGRREADAPRHPLGTALRQLHLLVEVTGADIKAALENGVSQIEQRAGRFPQVSGLKFEVDPKAAVGSRVSNIQVNGEALDPAKRYKVATNNFMLTGGDGYVPFTRGRVLIGTTDGKLWPTR
jgi:predicted phosphodiesterase